MPVKNEGSHEVWCGWDAEWVTVPDGKGGYRNEVLCIVAVIECGGRRTHYMHIPKGPLRADRPTMGGFFQRAIRMAIREGTIPSMPDAITIFGHFIRGDLASFVDFWARKREFSGLGKTVVSGRAGHALDLAGEAEGGGGAGEPPGGGMTKAPRAAGPARSGSTCARPMAAGSAYAPGSSTPSS
jgi:hypothetical protein